MGKMDELVIIFFFRIHARSTLITVGFNQNIRIGSPDTVIHLR